jgi:hypothetical protein
MPFETQSPRDLPKVLPKPESDARVAQNRKKLEDKISRDRESLEKTRRNNTMKEAKIRADAVKVIIERSDGTDLSRKIAEIAKRVYVTYGSAYQAIQEQEEDIPSLEIS